MIPIAEYNLYNIKVGDAVLLYDKVTDKNQKGQVIRSGPSTFEVESQHHVQHFFYSSKAVVEWPNSLSLVGVLDKKNYPEEYL